MKIVNTNWTLICAGHSSETVHIVGPHNNPLRHVPVLSYFIDEETEEQGNEVTCQGHKASKWQIRDLILGSLVSGS